MLAAHRVQDRFKLAEPSRRRNEARIAAGMRPRALHRLRVAVDRDQLDVRHRQRRARIAAAAIGAIHHQRAIHRRERVDHLFGKHGHMGAGMGRYGTLAHSPRHLTRAARLGLEQAEAVPGERAHLRFLRLVGGGFPDLEPVAEAHEFRLVRHAGGRQQFSVQHDPPAFIQLGLPGLAHDVVRKGDPAGVHQVEIGHRILELVHEEFARAFDARLVE